jgi:hypothetical protein
MASAASALCGSAAMAVNQGSAPRTRPRNSRSSASATGPRTPQQAQAGTWAPVSENSAMAGAEAALGASASTAMPGAGVSPGVSRWIGIRASKDQLVMH